MSRNESETLADAYQSVRNLSKAFISPFKDLDIEKKYFIGDVELNTPQWILSHLVWTENFLLLKGVGGEDAGIPWLDEYGFGSNPTDVKTRLSFDEIIGALDSVHERSMASIRKLSDSQLLEGNFINATFGNSRSKRNVIMHAIRHEPMHIGQLSWILKANGIKLA